VEWSDADDSFYCFALNFSDYLSKPRRDTELRDETETLAKMSETRPIWDPEFVSRVETLARPRRRDRERIPAYQYCIWFYVFSLNSACH